MHHSGSIGGVSRSALAGFGVAMDEAVRADIPADWRAAWTVAEWEPNVALSSHADGTVATLDKSPAEIFDLFSTARSAPANTYYVSPTGSDNDGQGTESLPWRSIWKAVEAANASGQPAKVIVRAGEYGKPTNPSMFIAMRPTVDIAFIAKGGRVVTGTWDDYANPPKDGTQTNCYGWSVATVDRVIDLSRHDADGFHPDLLRVDTAAICNRTPGSWAFVNGKIYVNRHDGKAVTNRNVRVLRSGGGTWRFDAPTSVYLGADDTISGFDTIGGSASAGFHYQPTAKPGSMKAVVVERSTFNYCGSDAINANGTIIGDLHGLALFVDCDASNNAKDGFSGSNYGGLDTDCHLVTVNCRSILCGRNAALSCNSFTLHEDVVGADFAGEFGRTNGGTIRCVAQSLTWLAGTRIFADRGDIVLGGTTPPGAIVANESAQIWADRVRIAMPPATTHAHADNAAAVHLRAMPPLRSAPQGTGLVDNW
ncbi:hypothetical protein [Croceicoccus naphthovorans]|uniref:Uncharacterized protein n=1 Tax=Croceicoccus naphthovorans TaxID=1348774 RepID=A0A0G3XDG4_9SPHN|nr:hypothetical protein [Croceicoccus naphthovorans]AKM09227.1 hypothetical protein AB433_03380 [Croceicoccus naphthovorans]MBB3990385.1 hypothetical protein [Croceicoccus naphthovorans]